MKNVQLYKQYVMLSACESNPELHNEVHVGVTYSLRLGFSKVVPLRD